jgi:2,5-dihydroxypyridine 5,6-dioxygenase
VVVAFPLRHSVRGRLVLGVGDINLTFKRYLESPVTLIIEDDYVTAVEGSGVDAILMRNYYDAWNDAEAYGVSHVGWGLNPKARYEALTVYDKRDTNGTELRALAGNFLFSTGANEHAGRYTLGHFDLPVLGCTIKLDDEVVVENGKLLGGSKWQMYITLREGAARPSFFCTELALIPRVSRSSSKRLPRRDITQCPGICRVMADRCH